MFNFLESKIRTIFDWHEASKGYRLVIVHIEEVCEGSHYTVQTDGGFLINIHCVETTFGSTYSSGMRLSKRMVLYEVRCFCDANTPEVLKAKLSVPRTVPSMVSTLTSREFRKKAAIQTYLDLVLSELKKT
jgi:hypothetical protein